jgi:hypothetical protein
VNKAAVNAAVLAELGMYAVSIQPLKLSISFWLHVLNSGENSLVSAAYKASLLLPNGIARSPLFYQWITIFVHSVQRVKLGWGNIVKWEFYNLKI